MRQGMSESATHSDSWDILNAIADGESARAACKRAGITHWALLKRLEKDPELAHHYTRAQQARAEKFADEIVQLADSADNTNWNAVRLQVDARKWVASKLLPKVYGDRLEVEEKRDVSITITIGAETQRAALPDAQVIDVSPIPSLPSQALPLGVSMPPQGEEGDPKRGRVGKRKRGPQGG